MRFRHRRLASRSPQQDQFSGSTRRLRRSVGLSVAGILALTLGACSSSKSNPPVSASSGSNTNGGADLAQYVGKPNKALCGGRHWTIGYDSFSDTDAFAVALKNGLEKAASELGCVTIKALVDNADAGTAVQNAKIFVQQKVDGAILFNVIQAASQGQSQALKAAKIPLVSLAVPVTGYPFITNDDSANGEQAGTALGNAFLKSGKSNGIAILGRFDDQDSTKQRMDGVIKGLKAVAPNVQVLQYATKADGPTTQSVTASLLPKVPAGSEILLAAPNDDLTYASLQAVKQANRLDDALAIGIGGTPPVGLDYMCKNPKQYAGVVGFFPENWPNYLLPALLASAQGATVPPKIVVPTSLITTQNVTQFYPDYKCG